jgi:hypothetical protein
VKLSGLKAGLSGHVPAKIFISGSRKNPLQGAAPNRSLHGTMKFGAAGREAQENTNQRD